MKLWVSVFALTLVVGLSAPAQAAFQLVAKDVFEKLNASAESNADVKKACASSKSSNACKTSKSKALFSIYQSNTNALINTMNEESFTPEEYKRINDIQGAWIKELTGKAYSEVLVLQKDRLSLVIDLFNAFERKADQSAKQNAFAEMEKANNALARKAIILAERTTSPNQWQTGSDTSNSIIQARDHCIEENFDGYNSTARSCYKNSYQQLDKQLNEIWLQIKSAAAPEEYKRILGEQRLWLKKRDASCERDRSAGELGELDQLECRDKVVADRNAELERELVTLIASKTQRVSIPQLKPSDLLTQFPICGISSSWGQSCKDLPRQLAKIETFIDLQDKAEAEGDSIKIETNDWYYEFAVSHTNKDTINISFRDQALRGSYNTMTDYEAKWQPDIKNWALVSQKLTFIAGPDDKRIGKKIKIDSPIPFVNMPVDQRQILRSRVAKDDRFECAKAGINCFNSPMINSMCFAYQWASGDNYKELGDNGMSFPGKVISKEPNKYAKLEPSWAEEGDGEYISFIRDLFDDCRNPEQKNDEIISRRTRDDLGAGWIEETIKTENGEDYAYFKIERELSSQSYCDSLLAEDSEISCASAAYVIVSRGKYTETYGIFGKYTAPNYHTMILPLRIFDDEEEFRADMAKRNY